MVLTTEKDAVRFAAFGELPFEVRAVPLRLALDDPEALTASVAAALERRTRTAA